MATAAAPRADFDPITGIAPRVYSYTRFSTPEQAQGDSLRRQTEGARRWTERKNEERERLGLPPLTLDHKLNLFDPGVSAYRGANTVADSALGGFLFACGQGLIPRGSYLLVESLDRISRMAPYRVQRLLVDIVVDAGVTLATLNDGQEYDSYRVENDPMALMIALMVSWRAHEESKVKAQRLSAAWIEKRRKVRAGEADKLTGKGPSWLQWTPSGWAERVPHADTVRRAYSLTLAGMGEHRIAETFNAEGVPVMGRGRMWHRSTISKLLRSPSVVGTLTPGRMDYSEGRKVRLLEDGIEGAFPAVVSQADWLAVRALKDGKAPAVRGRGASAPLSNLFAGLARCPDCGAAMTRVHKGKRSAPKLVCTRAKAGAAAHPYRSVALDTLQDTFMHSWRALGVDVPAGDAGGTLDHDHRNLEGVISAAEDDLERLAVLFDRAPSETCPTCAWRCPTWTFRSSLGAVSFAAKIRSGIAHLTSAGSPRGATFGPIAVVLSGTRSQAVATLCRQRGWTILAEFTEVESGKRDDRPELTAALKRAKVTGARLVIAKLDRLSRNVAFLAALQDSGAKFTAADMPEADEFTVHILAAVAQRERKLTSDRTKAALAAAKARGVRLGNPNGAAAIRRAAKGTGAALEAVRANAAARAEDYAETLADVRAGGATSLAAMAAELNARGIVTPRGGRWHPSSVRNLVGRLGAA